MYSGFNYICLTCPSISNYHLSYLIIRTPYDSRSESPHTVSTRKFEPLLNRNGGLTKCCSDVKPLLLCIIILRNTRLGRTRALDKEIKLCSQKKIDHLGELADHPTTLIHLCHHLGNFRLGLCVRQRDRWPVPCSCWPAPRWVWRASLVEPPSFSPPTSFVPETPFGTW